MELNYLLERQPAIYGNLPVALTEIPAFPNGNFKLHWHERFEMIIIEQGEMELSVGSEQFIAKKDDIILVNPRTTHAGCSLTESTIHRTIMFEFESFAHNQWAKHTLEPFILHNSAFVTKINDPDILAISKQLFDIKNSSDEGTELGIIGLSYYMLCLLISRHVDNFFLNPVNQKEFREILNYIAANYCDKITTSSISNMFGYNETYFCRRFKEITGLTPTDYIKILRLEKSKKFLKNSTMEITHIATECGFLSHNYFSRSFKARYGISPREYRAQNRSNL